MAMPRILLVELCIKDAEIILKEILSLSLFENIGRIGSVYDKTLLVRFGVVILNSSLRIGNVPIKKRLKSV